MDEEFEKEDESMYNEFSNLHAVISSKKYSEFI